MTSVNILMTFSIQTSPLPFSLCNARCSGHVVCPSSKGELGDLCMEIFYKFLYTHSPGAEVAKILQGLCWGPQPRTGVDSP